MIFVKISQNFIKPLKILPYLTDFSPQLMACTCMNRSRIGNNNTVSVVIIFHFLVHHL